MSAVMPAARRNHGFWLAVDLSIRQLSTVALWASCSAMVVLLILGAADNLGTALFGKAIPSAIELQEMFEAMVIFFAIVMVQHQRAHLGVDIITSSLGPRGRRACEVLALACTLALFVALTWQVFLLAARSWNVQEVSHGMLAFPVYPFKIAACIACTLVVLETCRQLVRALLGVEERVEASFTRDELLP